MNKFTKRVGIGVAALAMSAWSGAASAEDDGGKQGRQSEELGGYGTGMQAGKLSDKDKDFIKDAAQKTMAEIELAQLAQQKASSPAVKSFAQNLVRGHQKVSSELQQLSSSLGVQVPSTPTSDVRTQRDDLAKETGKNFDAKFMERIVSMHEDDVESFVSVAEKKDANPRLRTWAIDTLPELRHHLMSAENIQDQIKQSGQQQGGRGMQY